MRSFNSQGIIKNKIFIIPSKFLPQDEDIQVNALKFFIVTFNDFVTGVSNEYSSDDFHVHIFYNFAPYYVSFGLLEKVKIARTSAQQIQITKLGSNFYAMLEAKGMTNELEI